MKPLSELVKEWRIDGEKLSLSSDAALMNQANADELQAWLREAENWVANNRYQAVILLGENEVSNLGGQLVAEDVLSNLLGTTRTEGSPEKLSLKGKK